MKKILSLLLLLNVTFSTVNSQDIRINFEKGNFLSAKIKAKQQNKYVFFDAYTDWCGPCKVMDATVFRDEKVADLMNLNFVNIKVNMDSRPGIVLSAQLDINAFPTLLVFDAQGQEVFRHIGAYDTEEFIEVMQVVLKGENREFTNIKTKYNKGDNSIITTAIYIDYLQKLYMSKTLKDVVAGIKLSIEDMLIPDNNILFEVLISDFNSELSSEILDKAKLLKNEDKLSIAKEIIKKKLDEYLVANSVKSTYPPRFEAAKIYIEIAEKFGFNNNDNIHYQCAKMGEIMYGNNVLAALNYASERLFKSNLFKYSNFTHAMLSSSIFHYPFIKLGLKDTRIAYNKIGEMLKLKEVSGNSDYINFLGKIHKQLSNKILYYKIDDEIKKEKH